MYTICTYLYLNYLARAQCTQAALIISHLHGCVTQSDMLQVRVQQLLIHLCANRAGKRLGIANKCGIFCVCM